MPVPHRVQRDTAGTTAAPEHQAAVPETFAVSLRSAFLSKRAFPELLLVIRQGFDCQHRRLPVCGRSHMHGKYLCLCLVQHGYGEAIPHIGNWVSPIASR